MLTRKHTKDITNTKAEMTMSNTLYVMIGASGSGKSTLAKELSKLFFNTEIVASDGVRKKLWGDESDQQNPKKVFNHCEELICYHGGVLDENVVFDATNLSKKYRKRWIDIGQCCFNKVVAIWCNTSKANCIANQDKRERQVPINIVERQWDSLEPPTLDEGFDEVWIIREEMGLGNIRIIKKN